jgi:uncharacterized caspase-like protein
MKYISILVAMLMIAFAADARAQKRVALVIGNSAYRHVPQLANPINDAGDMSEKLRGMGFEVVSGHDLDLDGVRDRIRDFVSRLDGADIALFYYAGHGLQVNGENYLAPVDAQLSSAIDLDFETVPISLVMSAMERSAKVNLFFFDACRDNPLVDNLARSMGTRSGSVGRGLAKLGTGVGSLIAFATQPGNVALDGKERNSPFTAALLRHLGTPGQDITRDLVKVRRDVLAATDGRQVPWDNSSLTSEVVLVSAPVEKPDEAEAAASAAGTAGAAEADNSVELAYWDTIKSADDREYFTLYLKQYPQGAFAPLARMKIATIERRAAEAAARKAEEAKKAEETKKEKDAEEARKVQAEAQVAALAQHDSLPADDKPVGDLVQQVQKELNRLGCSAGGADGVWGQGSRRALGQFERHSGVDLAALEPTAAVLGALRARKTRVCPLVCGRNQEEKNGRCVKIPVEAKLPPVEKKNSGAAKKASNGSCPESALAAARQMADHGRIGYGKRTDFVTALHACGRKYTCSRAMDAAPWYCRWR